MARVCKPGGDIMVINHFASENAILRAWNGDSVRSPDSLAIRPSMDLSELPCPDGFRQIDIHRVNLLATGSRSTSAVILPKRPSVTAMQNRRPPQRPLRTGRPKQNTTHQQTQKRGAGNGTPLPFSARQMVCQRRSRIDPDPIRRSPEASTTRLSASPAALAADRSNPSKR